MTKTADKLAEALRRILKRAKEPEAEPNEEGLCAPMDISAGRARAIGHMALLAHEALAAYEAEKAQALPDMRAVCEALGFDPTNHHNAAKCPYCRPSGQAERVPMTEEQIVKCIIEAECLGKVNMSFESGPYDITRASINADKFVRAIERAHDIKPPKE